MFKELKNIVDQQQKNRRKKRYKKELQKFAFYIETIIDIF